MITARMAVDEHRELFAVPGDIGRVASVGCNLLIRDGACQVPARPLYLGRKAFTPTKPIFEQASDLPAEPLELLAQLPWEPPPWNLKFLPERLRVVVDSTPEKASTVSPDHPISFAPREHTLRYTHTEWITRPSIEVLP